MKFKKLKKTQTLAMSQLFMFEFFFNSNKKKGMFKNEYFINDLRNWIYYYFRYLCISSIN